MRAILWTVAVSMGCYRCTTASETDIDIVSKQLFDFYVGFGDCTQVEFCVEGGYNLPQIGSEGCGGTCDDSTHAMKTLSVDGSWPDVNYSDTTRSEWKAVLHMERVLSMSRSYHCPSCTSLYQNPDVITQSRKAITYWTTKKITNPNWWWMDIGLPQYAGAIGILLNSSLEPTELDSLTSLMDTVGNGNRGVGENLMWQQQVAINREVLRRNDSYVSMIFDAMWTTIKLSPGSDGVQVDGSFHFHGAILYAGGYGADFALQITTIASIASGTKYQAPAEVMKVFDIYLLDGTQYFVIDTPGPNAFYDVSTKGREIARAPYGNLRFPANVYSSLLNSSYFTQSQRGMEYEAFAARLLESSATPFTSSKHFFMSDYAAHHRENFSITLKMSSTRMDNNEVCNGEGLKSWNTGDGVLLPYRAGDEYEGIFPVWDWTALPGTTSRWKIEGNSNNVRHAGKTSFVGGATENTSKPLVVSTMDFESPDSGGEGESSSTVYALKSWFFVDQGVVALATNVSLQYNGQQLITTLDQSLQRSDITIKSSSTSQCSVLPNKTSYVAMAAGGWLHHNDQLYLTPYGDVKGSVSVIVGGGPQNGSWYEIADDESNATVSKNVFFAAIDHGLSPNVNTTNVAYAIVPAVNVGDAESVAASFAKSVKVISNENDVQAVLYTPLSSKGFAVLAVVRSIDDSSALVPIQVTDAGLNLAVTPGAIVIIRDDGSGVLTFTAASPQPSSKSEPLKDVVITINKKLAVTASGEFQCVFDSSKSLTTVTITLPSNSTMVGSSIMGSC